MIIVEDGGELFRVAFDPNIDYSIMIYLYMFACCPRLVLSKEEAKTACIKAAVSMYGCSWLQVSLSIYSIENIANM